MRTVSGALKWIGIILFVGIILQLDHVALIDALAKTNITLLCLAFVLQFGIYAFKTMRWHTLTLAAGTHTTFVESWKMYNIGMFLGLITPGRLGEFGKAAYLQEKGMPMSTAVSLPVIDRLADAIIISLMSIAGVFVLFPVKTAFLLCGVGIVLAIIFWWIWRKTRSVSWLQFLHRLQFQTFAAIGLQTLLGWVLYFLWASLLAKSIGIELPISVLVSVFAFTGIVALLPIAPSGFGTRDATLITLLAPYGIDSPTAVALAMLMFVTIFAGGGLGFVYWVLQKRGPRT